MSSTNQSGNHGRNSHNVSAEQLKKMIEAFKKNPLGGKGPKGEQRETTRFVHFPIRQVLDQLVSNRIIEEHDTVETMFRKTGEHGIKVYFAQHADPSDCPEPWEETIGYNTVVLVNTVLNPKTKKWDDMLADVPHELPGKAVTMSLTAHNSSAGAGQGSDKANMCPPQCKGFGQTL